jgi:hypothetical protein
MTLTVRRTRARFDLGPVNGMGVCSFSPSSTRSNSDFLTRPVRSFRFLVPSMTVATRHVTNFLSLTFACTIEWDGLTGEHDFNCISGFYLC